MRRGFVPEPLKARPVRTALGVLCEGELLLPLRNGGICGFRWQVGGATGLPAVIDARFFQNRSIQVAI